MAVSPEILDILLAKGVDAKTIVDIVKADQRLEEQRSADRRAKAAEKKRNQRSVLRGDTDQVLGTCEDFRGLEGTKGDGEGQPGLENSSPPKSNIKPPNPSLRSDLVSARRAWFSELWTVLPHRSGDGKQPAEEKFLRLLRDAKDPEGLWSEILDGAKSYAETKAGTDRQFIKATSVWLNAAGWRDDHSPASSQAANGARAGPSLTHHKPNNRIAAANDLLAKLHERSH